MPLNTLPFSAVTTVPDIGLVGKQLKAKFRASIREAHLEAVERAKNILKASIILSDSVATGNLLKSVSSRFVRNSSVDGYTSEIYFKRPASSYAYFANYGRDSGGMPPRRVMLKWARARGIDESLVYPISKKIAEYGTGEFDGGEGKQFMEDAQKKIQQDFRERIQNAVTKLIGSYK